MPPIVIRDYAQFMRDQHYAASDAATRWNVVLGIPVVIVSAVVSTSIFASINGSPGNGWKIGAGLVSLAAAALSALQTFFKFPETGERHRLAAARYGHVRREAEVFSLHYSGGDSAQRDTALTELETIANKLGELDEVSPAIARRTSRRGGRTRWAPRSRRGGQPEEPART
jgi:hypothetical protein